MPKTKDSKAQKSATNKSSAGKRTATPTAGRTGAKPSPKAERSPASTPQRSPKSRSTNVAKVPSKAAARSTGANVQSQRAAQKDCAVAEVDKSQERLGAIQRLKYILKRIIGYKKGERDEFRYNNVTGHPNYEFQNENGKIKAFGITHKEKTFGRKNMPLSKNPKKGKSEDSYIRNGIIKADEEVLSEKVLRNFEFAQEDIPNVKSKKRYHKKESQRQKAKQSNKKSK